MKARLLGLLPAKALAFDVSVLFGGFGLQLLTQIGWLLLALRLLGPEGYGLFAALTAITVAAGCFAGWGSDQLLIREVAREPSAMRRWVGHGLLSILVTALPLGLLLFLLLPLIEAGRIGALALACVLLADLWLGRWANLAIAIYMAGGRSARQSTVTVIPGALRLAAILLAGLVHAPLTLSAFAAWYAGAAALSALICLGLVVRDHGWPHAGWIPGLWGEGLAFAAESALQASVKDLDKPIVLQFLGAEAAGLYAAALRIVEVLALPIRALGYAIYARMFKLAAEDLAECRRLARRSLGLAVALGLAGGLGLLVFAGLLPWVFGAAYQALPALVRWLSPMPALFGAFVIGADLLTAVGRQSHRLAVVITSLALTLGTCWWLTPLLGMEGAILARLGVQAVTAALVWALALRGGAR
ncbi:oligosaccharide flippase family protein [Roseococcus sp. SDR]|uniref:lipopolysaccharide biosynthesis protein n=1 Tax=Roseococcus sp. SDR TaxID=2835532 RepID=UPI001BCC529F|nr:oligosaccharide flippase family protein [Roseococcus sp. SDR]MBS7791985.1 oligosaccharide flippase family protein [Roseococcus sp. SDR]MBV1847299.1 oligosaccharide flippase family protein [Roseococcus sp. SDR]